MDAQEPQGARVAATEVVGTLALIPNETEGSERKWCI